ncbi:uncharacterized protein LOC118152303 isoform X2 [Callithrix jacchus]
MGCRLSLLLLPHGVPEPGGRDTLKPRVCAGWRGLGAPGLPTARATGIARAAPGEVMAADHRSGHPSAGRPAAGRWCPPHPNTQGNPAKVTLRLRPSSSTAQQSPVLPKIVLSTFPLEHRSSPKGELGMGYRLKKMKRYLRSPAASECHIL